MYKIEKSHTMLIASYSGSLLNYNNFKIFISLRYVSRVSDTLQMIYCLRFIYSDIFLYDRIHWSLLCFVRYKLQLSDTLISIDSVVSNTFLYYWIHWFLRCCCVGYNFYCRILTINRFIMEECIQEENFVVLINGWEILR